MDLYPAEIDKSDPKSWVSGFIVRMPSGLSLQVAWRAPAPIVPPLDAAKQYAAELITALQKRNAHKDLEVTNWPSAVAAIQKVILDFNEKISAHLYTMAPATLQ